jgi:hypothetical protein
VSAGFLGRLYRLGRNLVSYGLGGGSSAPTVTSIVEVCVTRSIPAGPVIMRPLAPCAVTRAIDATIPVRRPIPGTNRVTRTMPSC